MSRVRFPGVGMALPAHGKAVRVHGSLGHTSAMSRLAANANRIHRTQLVQSGLSDDLYDYLRTEPWPRPGRPHTHILCDWTISDDWPECPPVTSSEVDVFEAWFGDIFDRLFGAGP